MKAVFTQFLSFLLMVTGSAVFAQSNYSQTNFRFSQVSYSDISGTGTPISMTNPETGSSTTPQNIGFDFTFNGTLFTQFMIHADGILKLGTVAPGAATDIAVSPANSYTAVFTNTTDAFQNIIMPFFTNLVKGGADPEFHVQTTGTAPNRVCVVQWKNLRDADNTNGGAQHQFSNLQFQVRFYEGTNDIEFIYGSFTPSASTSLVRNAAVGIKASSTSFLGTFRVNSLIPFTKTAVMNTVAHNRLNSQFRFSKSTIPPTGFSTRFFGRMNNDINVAKIYFDSVTTVGEQSPGQIEALIANEGVNTLTNIEVTVALSGANTQNSTVTIPSLAGGSSQYVTFPAFPQTNKGQQQISVSVVTTGDERTGNNTLQVQQQVSQSQLQTYDFSNTGVGVGFNGVSNYAGFKIYGKGTRKITQLRIPFNTYRNPVRVMIYEDGGAGGAPSSTSLFTTTNFFTTSENTMIIPVDPAITVTDDYYVVVHQTSTANMGWRVTVTNPGRNRVFNSSNGSTWGPESVLPPWQFLVDVYEENTGPDIGIEQLTSPACGYSTTAEVKVKLRNFSSAAIDFSTTPTTITGTVQYPSGTGVPFSFTKNSGTLAAGASEQVTVLTGFDYTPRGYYLISARTNLAGDIEKGNDSLRFFIGNHVPVTRNVGTPVCPLTEVILTGPAYLANLQWNRDGFISSGTTLTFRPIKTTTVYVSGTDYRGCLLQDSVIVEVTGTGLPPRPVLLFGDTVLSHRNQFKDTIRVTNLPGHTVQWLGGLGTPVSDTALIVDQVIGLQGAKIAAAYTRTSDGCSNISDTLTYNYAPGVLHNSNLPLTLCDSSFYDAGGPSGNTGNNFTRTFTPATPGRKMKLTIYRLDLANFSTLFVHDGPTTSSPRIIALANTENGNTVREFIASNEAGVLTVRFAVGSATGQGWWAGLTCHQPEVYRTVANGNWSDKNIWEKKAPGGNFMAATRAPFKGDDSIYVRHNVLINTSTPTDQVIVEEAGHLRIESPNTNFISIPAYKTVNQAEFLVKGTLTTNSFVQIFGSNGVLTVNGNFANAGQIDFDSVFLTGTTPQTLGRPGFSTGRLKNIKISNPAGVTVLGDQSVIGLAFDKGLIHTSNSAMITFTQTGSNFVTGAGNTAFINGPARVNIFGTGERFYPIGKNGIYRPVTVSNSNATSFDNADEVVVEMIAGAPANRTLPSGINAVSQVRHYRITKTGTNSTDFQVTIPYGTDDGVSDPGNLTLVKDNGAGAWLDIGGTATGAAPGTILSNEFNGFSDFVLANKTGGNNGLVTSVRSFSTQLLPGVKLYPNPVPGMLNVQLPHSLQHKQVEIRLLDLQGRELKRWNFRQVASSLQLGMEGLPAGTYLLDIRSGQQQHVEMLRKQ